MAEGYSHQRVVALQTRKHAFNAMITILHTTTRRYLIVMKV